MSFTSLPIIKRHLLNCTTSVLRFRNQPVTLNGTDDVELPHPSLVDNSAVVKWQHELFPEQEGPIALLNFDWQTLTFAQLVPESVVVAIDPVLNTVFLEEVDYKVDYDAGRIRRVDGGAIAPSQTVYVFYNKYTLFSGESDYHLDAVLGRIARTESSSIPDGATVVMDYSVGMGEVLDNLINQAILEAEDLIVRSLSSEYNSSSTETGLQTGATELALSIVTRDLAGETLKQWRASDAYQRSKEWRELSATYERRAYQILAPYLLPNYMRSSQAISSQG